MRKMLGESIVLDFEGGVVHVCDDNRAIKSSAFTFKWVSWNKNSNQNLPHSILILGVFNFKVLISKASTMKVMITFSLIMKSSPTKSLITKFSITKSSIMKYLISKSFDLVSKLDQVSLNNSI